VLSGQNSINLKTHLKAQHPYAYKLVDETDEGRSKYRNLYLSSLSKTASSGSGGVSQSKITEDFGK
jgi:hypothetical protein